MDRALWPDRLWFPWCSPSGHKVSDSSSAPAMREATHPAMWGGRRRRGALPTVHAHLLTWCESSQLLDLGGLVVAAPSAEQDLAAYPLLRLRRVPGTGYTAHHMVQVFHVLCWDWLVVVSILGRKRGPGEWGPTQGSRQPYSGFLYTKEQQHFF